MINQNKPARTKKDKTTTKFQGIFQSEKEIETCSKLNLLLMSSAKKKEMSIWVLKKRDVVMDKVWLQSTFEHKIGIRDKC